MSNESDIKNAPLSILFLPIRVLNVLNLAGFETIGDICKASRTECEKNLMKYRYFAARGRHSELPDLLNQLERLGVWNKPVRPPTES